MSNIPPFNDKIQAITSLLLDGGATDVLLVGGFVRDWLMGIESEDIDLEVYGLSYPEMITLLRQRFHVNLVGQSFGVLKVDNAIDIALPRRESKVGTGHTGFEVQAEPSLSYEEALSRRDYTINSMGMRIVDGTIIDPYHGQRDLQHKILRATGPAFADDPLRVLRGVQFAARFGLTMDSKTISLCQSLFGELDTLSMERVYGEWYKWALKGKYPSKGLQVLFQTGWIAGFPEVQALVGCPQNPNWHPEGDVWEHTKIVCDQMKNLISGQSKSGSHLDAVISTLTAEDQVTLMFAALAHDFGKPSTTSQGEDGVVRSLGHAATGALLAQSFLERMKAPTRLVEMVVSLVREHMIRINSDRDQERPSPKMVRRLACRLWPANINLWTALCQSDAQGCFLPDDSQSLERNIRFKADDWLTLALENQVTSSKPQPLVLGRHLIAMGIAPGTTMGKILEAAFEAQVNGDYTSTETGIEWVKKKRKKFPFR